MIRAQIYLTSQQGHALENIAKRSGRKKSAVIREALDQLIKQNDAADRNQVIREAAGIWKDRTDLPDFHVLRSSWDREKA